eukprot:1090503-Prymnesium_polylepis.1
MESTDPRMQWVEDRLVALLKTKGEIFRKLAETEEGGEVIKRFLDDDSMPKMYAARRLGEAKRS